MGRSLDSQPCGRSRIHRQLFSNNALARIQKLHFRSGSLYYRDVVVTLALALESREGRLGVGFGSATGYERTICFYDEVWIVRISGLCRRRHFSAKFSIQSAFVDRYFCVMDSANLASDSADHLSVGRLIYEQKSFYLCWTRAVCASVILF